MADDEIDFSYLEELKSLGSTKKEQKVVKPPRKTAMAPPSQDAVKALLRKKEKDKQKKVDDFNRKRKDLLSIRAQDKGSQKVMKSLITRNKGASKAVMDDAKDLLVKHDTDSVVGDYGYESTSNDAIFAKLSGEYETMPEDSRLQKTKANPVGDMKDIKSRVLQNLKKQKEEEEGPRKRKRREKFATDEFIDDSERSEERRKKRRADDDHREKRRKKEEVVVKRPVLPVIPALLRPKSSEESVFKYEDKAKDARKQMELKKKRLENNKTVAPPPSFEEILRKAKENAANVALKKSTEEIVMEELAKAKELKKKKKAERPLSAREKEEAEETRLRKLRREGKLPDKPVEKVREKEPKKKEEKPLLKEALSKERERDSKSAVPDKKPSTSNGIAKPNSAPENWSRPSKRKPDPPPKIKNPTKYFAVAGTGIKKADDKPSNTESKSVKPASSRDSDRRKEYRESSGYSNSSKSSKSNGHSSSSKNRSEEYSERYSRSKYSPPPRPKPGKFGGSRLRIDSESEEDSEMDDFIDDGDCGNDYSAEIRKMFGYDKRKFADEDDDLSDMVAGFSQVEDEEKTSARIGYEEDMEDMRMEERERKRKLAKKKMQGRR